MIAILVGQDFNLLPFFIARYYFVYTQIAMGKENESVLRFTHAADENHSEREVQGSNLKGG